MGKIKEILPKEKSPVTVGRPVVLYRKVLYGILYLEQDASGRCFQKNTVQVQHAIEDFKNGIILMYLKRHGLDYRKSIKHDWYRLDMAINLLIQYQ